MLKIVK